MELFACFGGVWASILLGIFFIAMVFGCTLDRRYTEEPKWWILIAGVIVYVIWNWSSLSWSGFLSPDLWKTVGIYLAIGVGYSLFEFMMEVRRSARYWKGLWESSKASGRTGNSFYENYHERVWDKRVITIKKDPESPTGISEVINRQQLAEAVGCWITFWPFYAVSLVLGDLMTEVFRVVADVLASISGRFVKLAFKDVFK